MNSDNLVRPRRLPALKDVLRLVSDLRGRSRTWD